MVRRVGFGNSPKPENRSKPSIRSVQPSARAKPISNARTSEPKDATPEVPLPLTRLQVFFKAAQIVIVIVIASKIASDLVFMILLAWAGLAIYKLAKSVKASMNTRY
jgi:hypothetical protein